MGYDLDYDDDEVYDDYYDQADIGEDDFYVYDDDGNEMERGTVSATSSAPAVKRERMKVTLYKTSVINDPLGHSNSHTSFLL